MKAIFVFDVDGTLTPCRKNIDKETHDFLQEIRKSYPVAIVGGSDLNKIAEQLANHDKTKLTTEYDYVFSENGMVGFHGEKELPTHSIHEKLGEEKLQKLINFTLNYFSNITLPVKRGNFIEFRKGMLNLSPIGRSCSQEERDNFVIYDAEHGIREKFVKALEAEFSSFGLTFAVGGQISVDAYPNGWDKTFCLQYFADQYERIYFFGDKTAPGGNDHAIFVDPRTIGHTVAGPSDTRQQVSKALEELKTI
ncbi:unnamed protein product [Auanema sp. JU1783]|nr:unnamed protein product [Auanema sp. JU1783]